MDTRKQGRLHVTAQRRSVWRTIWVAVWVRVVGEPRRVRNEGRKLHNAEPHGGAFVLTGIARAGLSSTMCWCVATVSPVRLIRVPNSDYVPAPD